MEDDRTLEFGDNIASRLSEGFDESAVSVLTEVQNPKLVLGSVETATRLTEEYYSLCRPMDALWKRRLDKQ